MFVGWNGRIESGYGYEIMCTGIGEEEIKERLRWWLKNGVGEGDVLLMLYVKVVLASYRDGVSLGDASMGGRGGRGGAAVRGPSGKCGLPVSRSGGGRTIGSYRRVVNVVQSVCSRCGKVRRTSRGATRRVVGQVGRVVGRGKGPIVNSSRCSIVSGCRGVRRFLGSTRRRRGKDMVLCRTSASNKVAEGRCDCSKGRVDIVSTGVV